jgi:hypothetical protein
VDIRQPNIIVMWESIGEGCNFVSFLEKFFGGWAFQFIMLGVYLGGLSLDGMKGSYRSLILGLVNQVWEQCYILLNLVEILLL